MSAQSASSNRSPIVSVIVVAFNRADLLDDCLASLLAQPDSWQLEIHIVSKAAAPARRVGPTQSPRVYWHQATATATIPAMRRLGMLHANTPLLALLEDDCKVGPQWLHALVSAHREGHIAVGGAVEPGAFSRGLDWGIFYCEFSRFLAPFSGPVTALPGNNVAYKSESLDPAQFKLGFYDVFVHEQWQKSGHTLFAADGMVVKNNNTWHLVNCTVSPFHHGRAYASQRVGRGFSYQRLIYCLLSPLLPFIKAFRTVAEVRAKQRRELPLASALPWVAVFCTCWSAGEFLGYLSGPGNSVEKWC